MIGDDIRAHMTQEAPRECCGVVIRVDGELVYVPCRNISDGENEFIMHPHDYAAAEDSGELCAIVHSHPNGTSELSPPDREALKYSSVDWLIVGQDGTITGYKCNQDHSEASDGDDNGGAVRSPSAEVRAEL